jgi:hypothetical protein
MDQSADWEGCAITGARENLHGSGIDLAWIEAVPKPKNEAPHDMEAFFGQKRAVLSAFFTALVVLGTFTIGALLFASLAFDAMGISP